MFTENKVKCTHLTGTNLGWWEIDTPHVDSPHMGHQTRMVGIISTVFVTKHLGWCWCVYTHDVLRNWQWQQITLLQHIPGYRDVADYVIDTSWSKVCRIDCVPSQHKTIVLANCTVGGNQWPPSAHVSHQSAQCNGREVLICKMYTTRLI